MAGIDWWVLVPEASEMNVAGTVADAFIVGIVKGSPVDNELTSNYTGRVTVNGVANGARRIPLPI